MVILINNCEYSRSNINDFFFIYDHPPVLVYRIIVPHNISANFTYNWDRLLILHLKLRECGLRLLVYYIAVIVYDLVVKLIILVIFLILLLFWKRIYLSLLFFQFLLFDFLSYFFEGSIVIDGIMILNLENAHLISFIKQTFCHLVLQLVRIVIKIIIVWVLRFLFTLVFSHLTLYHIKWVFYIFIFCFCLFYFIFISY